MPRKSKKSVGVVLETDDEIAIDDGEEIGDYPPEQPQKQVPQTFGSIPRLGGRMRELPSMPITPDRRTRPAPQRAKIPSRKGGPILM